MHECAELFLRILRFKHINEPLRDILTAEAQRTESAAESIVFYDIAARGKHGDRGMNLLFNHLYFINLIYFSNLCALCVSFAFFAILFLAENTETAE